LGNITKPKNYGIGLHLIDCPDRGFESGCGNGCSVLCLWFVLKVAASATGWSLVQRSPTGCVCVCLIVSDLETLKRSYLGTIWAVVPQEKKITIYIVQHST